MEGERKGRGRGVGVGGVKGEGATEEVQNEWSHAHIASFFPFLYPSAAAQRQEA